MNIFETLQKGKGSINEENISSFLGYLLDPNEDHDLKTVFFEKFLKFVDIKDSEIKITNTDSLKINFGFPVSLDDKTRYIDLVFETNSHIIAIENKIAEKSKQPKQVQEEYDGLRESQYFKNKNKSILMLFLVPENKGESIEIKENSNDKYKIILWKDIIEILKTILKYENNADINPINEYIKQTIKAFINFMDNTLHPKYFSLDKDTFRIYKYSSGKIVLEIENENSWENMPARPIIRKKLEQLQPDEFDFKQTETSNTQSLGANLFKIL